MTTGRPPLTPRQICENRLKADARNINDIEQRLQVGQNVRSELLAYLVADVASRWRMARKIDCGAGDLSRSAGHNLDRAVTLYERQVIPSEVLR